MILLNGMFITSTKDEGSVTAGVCLVAKKTTKRYEWMKPNQYEKATRPLTSKISGT